MDGNRRWAKSKFLPVTAGHKAWAENAKKIARHGKTLGIRYLTLWALSTDNLQKREETEVTAIIKLINNIESILGEILEDGVRFETIGNIEKLPQASQEVLMRVKEKTKQNTQLILTLALVYWWQDEIVRATQKILKENKNPDELSKAEFKNYLDTYFLPAPNLIIRTGGDVRHSGFLLYDSEYAEYYFTEKKWPEFDENELEKAIDFYNSSKRNFGK